MYPQGFKAWCGRLSSRHDPGLHIGNAWWQLRALRGLQETVKGLAYRAVLASPGLTASGSDSSESSSELLPGARILNVGV